MTRPGDSAMVLGTLAGLVLLHWFTFMVAMVLRRWDIAVFCFAFTLCGAVGFLWLISEIGKDA